jgi:hypothetical protein
MPLPPMPPFGPETEWPPVSSAYVAPPPVTKGRGKVPCIALGCLAAVVLLVVGGIAIYTALGSLLPATLLPGSSLGTSPTPAGQVTRLPETTVAPAAPPTATAPAATATPAPPTATRVPPTATGTPTRTGTPTATSTPKPTATSTATPTPVQVYTADFSGAAPDWNQKTDANGRQYLQSSAYHVVVSTTIPYVGWQFPVSKPVFKDFTLEVKGRYESGLDTNGFGALFRYVDEGNLYKMDVTSAGKWQFAKRVNGAWTGLVPWTSDSAILKGNASNTLRIVAKGSNFTFFVNGKQVGTFTDNSLAAGTVGVITSNDKPGNFHVVYEALKATILLP